MTDIGSERETNTERMIDRETEIEQEMREMKRERETEKI